MARYNSVIADENGSLKFLFRLALSLRLTQPTYPMYIPSLSLSLSYSLWHSIWCVARAITVLLMTSLANIFMRAPFMFGIQLYAGLVVLCG